MANWCVVLFCSKLPKEEAKVQKLECQLSGHIGTRGVQITEYSVQLPKWFQSSIYSYLLLPPWASHLNTIMYLSIDLFPLHCAVQVDWISEVLISDILLY